MEKFSKKESLTAITHQPSPFLNKCELTFLNSTEIDLEKTKLQHKNYCRMLSGLGVKVIDLDKNLSMPDCAFVEDTAIVLDELAVITPMGIATRRRETRLIERELGRFRQIKKIIPPAKIEGGDVLQIGKDLYVGRSTRTNKKGIAALEDIVKPFGYKVYAVTVKNSLHLKTASTALDEETVLLNREWIDEREFFGFRKVFVPPEEPFAANILKIKDTICIHPAWKKTIKLIKGFGYRIKHIDISEFLKAEAGLTCLSLIFREEETDESTG